MAGLIDLVGTGEIGRDSTVLYAHLGGQPALNAYSGICADGCRRPSDDLATVINCRDTRALAEFYRELSVCGSGQATNRTSPAVRSPTGWCCRHPNGSRALALGLLRLRAADLAQRPAAADGCTWTPSCPPSTNSRRQRGRALALGARELLDRSDNPDKPYSSSPTRPVIRSASSSPTDLPHRARGPGPDADRWAAGTLFVFPGEGRAEPTIPRIADQGGDRLQGQGQVRPEVGGRGPAATGPGSAAEADPPS